MKHFQASHPRWLLLAAFPKAVVCAFAGNATRVGVYPRVRVPLDADRDEIQEIADRFPREMGAIDVGQ